MSLDESFWETHFHGPFGAPVDTAGGGWRWFSSELHSMASGDCRVPVSQVNLAGQQAATRERVRAAPVCFLSIYFSP